MTDKRSLDAPLKPLSVRETGTAIALFRIGVGLTILAAVGRTVVHGLAPAVWLDAADGGMLPLGEQPWLVEALGGLSPQTMWLVVGANLFLAALLTLGLGGRLTVFLLLQANLALTFINDYVQGCDHKLISNALWLLFLAPSTATLSLDCRLRKGRWTSEQPVPAWPRYLVIWQLVLVYCTTGLQKVSIYWTPAGDYSALYRILQEPCWQRWDMSWLATVYPLTQFATAATWLWEVTFPVVLLAMHYRRTADRPGRLRALFNRLHVLEAYIFAGVLLHLGVWLLIDLGPFTWITLSCYFCLLPSERWERLAARITHRRGWHALTFRERRDDFERPQPIAQTTALVGPPWLVTAFVAFHLTAVTLAALPSPAGAMSRSLWESPAARSEFEQWAGVLNGLGIDVSADELEPFLWRACWKYVEVREIALKPFSPYFKYCGTRQGWPMFTGPDTTPVRLSVAIEEDEEWRTIYVQRDPRHDWRKRQLGQEHVRTAIHSVSDEPDGDGFRKLSAWIARLAAADFPAATRVRVSMERMQIPSPERARTGETATGKPWGHVTVEVR